MEALERIDATRAETLQNPCPHYERLRRLANVCFADPA